jgi:PhzF family phenazine biosynthesis protein
MKLRYHQVDAFTDELFHGNPAGVCPLAEWLPGATMQKIAMENNQAETAFYVRGPVRHHIRWFTPAVEVDLCGHATLAASHIIFSVDGFPGPAVEFDSRSGVLVVRREGDLLTLDFPADSPSLVAPPRDLIEALGAAPREAYKGKTDYLLVYSSQGDIERMRPDFALLARTPARGVIVTAPGDAVDFVSRFFAPQVGINEDPVTGSAHTTLTPFWASRLGLEEMDARQLSRRGGKLHCRLAGGRVLISGQARDYLQGIIELPD